ncbi:hypothetical protein GT037_003948 [Alternaria burnsii]|uniref:Uncharacterized protein n=1 Tax=Alternaria burnsii TaxID=1187904 RepID=A0A8H7BB88_9PLEO|nr:uncharacterized protein GT037_003948 [Alternaria burnsii]KAF7678567.1 hypothetical protein GT037_003948 [Alternaria burnsii]
MVARYQRIKYPNPGERQHGESMAAQWDLQIRKKQDEAYSNLIREFLPNQPPVGVYRNLRGDLLKIVQIDTGFMREDSPDLQEMLEPGHLWMPAVVSGLPGTQFNEEREYLFDHFKYVLVEPLEIGFNKVAINGVVVYQRKQIRVAMNAEKKTVWEAVETDQFDPSQQCFFGAPDGDPQVNPTSTPRPSRTPSSDSAVNLPITPP